ncbi:MAG: TlpA disulfide reductase family protein [Pyrinomonadaceae bacterium]
MNVDAGSSVEAVKPQVLVTELMGRAFEFRQTGKLNQAVESLEQAIAEARKTPFEVEFQTRIQLAMTLGDAYQSVSEIEKAREMLSAESAFAEKISQVMQATGTPPQKRAATAGFLQIRDRSIQLSLLGNEAPEVSVKEWLVGEPTSLAELRGRVVLLEFWATWCKPCQEMFPKLNELHQIEGPRGLEVIALTRHYMAYAGTDESKIEERGLMLGMVKQHQVSFRVGIADDERLQAVFGANGLPTIVLVDRNGIVRYAGPGENGPVFNKELQQSLKV